MSAPNALNQLFEAFARVGNAAADGRSISLAQVEQWLQQSRLLGDRVTTADVASVFGKFKTPTIGFGDFMTMVEDLAGAKRISGEELRQQLAQATLPGAQATATEVAGTPRNGGCCGK